MSKFRLEKYNLTELKQMASRMDLPPRRSKTEMIKDISSAFAEYEEYKKDKIDRYTRISQLGEKGKEGTTYLVLDANGKEYAMKTFRKGKSSATLHREYSLQKKASRKGVAPKVYDYDTVGKWILMEKMDSHLITDLNHINLSKKQQERIIDIFKRLDDSRVLQGDANILNLMVKNGEIYLIDYGFAKEITPQLCKKLGTEHPNYHSMTIGFILKLKEHGASEKSYRYLLKHVSKEDKVKYHLNTIQS